MELFVGLISLLCHQLCHPTQKCTPSNTHVYTSKPIHTLSLHSLHHNCLQPLLGVTSAMLTSKQLMVGGGDLHARVCMYVWRLHLFSLSFNQVVLLNMSHCRCHSVCHSVASVIICPNWTGHVLIAFLISMLVYVFPSFWHTNRLGQPCASTTVRGKYPLVQGKSRSTSSWDDYTHGKQGFRLPPKLEHTHLNTYVDTHCCQCTY